MAHWSQSFAEKINGLYKTYKDEMGCLSSPESIGETDIHEFVKYRNSVTHGRHRIMADSIVRTAHILCGLVYCSILNRIGIDKNTIMFLCKNKIIIS